MHSQSPVYKEALKASRRSPASHHSQNIPTISQFLDILSSKVLALIHGCISTVFSRYSLPFMMLEWLERSLNTESVPGKGYWPNRTLELELSGGDEMVRSRSKQANVSHSLRE